MAREKRRRALRILLGTLVMLILAAIPLVILSRYAGSWGVPYFTFTTERGSVCTNDFTGYHCDDLTLADIRWWGDIYLPPNAIVQSSHYKSTHDFELDAVVEVPKQSATPTLAAVRKTFGSCIPDHPTRLETEGLRGVCVMANDATDSTDSDARLSDTLYEITTATKPDGTLVINIHEESR
jgi:hypothetical protein